jgi:hypothetical protein
MTAKQFSLRFILYATLAIGIGMAWIGSRIRESKIEDRRAQELRSIGGTIIRHDWGIDLQGRLISVQRQRKWPVRLLQFVGLNLCSPVVEVNLSECEDVGNHMHLLGDLRHVERLYLQDTDVCDKQLKVLSKLPQLQTLSLDGTQITRSSLAHVSTLAYLKELSVARTGVSSGGLRLIARLRDLQVLDLANTTIDDGAVPYLCMMNNLDQLFLENTHLTSAGVQKVQDALPSTEIWSEHQTTPHGKRANRG